MQWSFFLSPTPVQQQLQQQPQQHEQQLYPVRQWHSVHGYRMQECNWPSTVDGEAITMEEAESDHPQQEDTWRSAEYVHSTTSFLL